MLGEQSAAALSTSTSFGMDPGLVWTPAVMERIASFLSPSEVACLRRVDRATAELFRHHTTLHLSQPVPHWAFQERWSAPGSCRALTLAQRRQLVALTARSNEVANLQAALVATRLSPSEEDLLSAAAAGALRSCAWLAMPGRLPDGVPWPRVLSVAARAGQRRVCEWALQACPSIRTREALQDAALEAVRGGQVDVMEWLLAQSRTAAAHCSTSRFGVGSRQSQSLVDVPIAAALGCELPTLQRLWAQHGGPEEAQGPAAAPAIRVLGVTGRPPHVLLEAALRNALCSPTPDWQAKADWLVDAKGARSNLSSYYSAAAELAPPGCAAARFAWLRGRGVRPTAAALGAAVAAGDVAALEWLLGEALLALVPDADEAAFLVQSAARAGHVRVLQRLEQAGARVSPEDVAQAAARGGHVPVLQWAWDSFPRSRRTLLAARVFVAAAGSGSVEALRWLQERGCDMHSTGGAWTAAVGSGCEAAVELLGELRCPMLPGGEPFAVAVRRREWGMLPLLGSQGSLDLGPLPWSLFTEAVGGGAPLPTLQLLASELGPDVIDWAEAEAEAETLEGQARPYAYGSAEPYAVGDGPTGQEEVLVWIREQAARWGGGRAGGKGQARRSI